MPPLEGSGCQVVRVEMGAVVVGGGGKPKVPRRGGAVGYRRPHKRSLPAENHPLSVPLAPPVLGSGTETPTVASVRVVVVVVVVVMVMVARVVLVIRVVRLSREGVGEVLGPLHHHLGCHGDAVCVQRVLDLRDR